MPYERTNRRYAAKMQQCFAVKKDIFYTLLDSLFRIVLFTESGNQWSLSKPILSLMLADQAAFEQLKTFYVDTQTVNAEAKAEMVAAFQQLVHEIRPNLEQGNRDRFSQHVSQFRTSVLPLITKRL
jgi:exportin-7